MGTSRTPSKETISMTFKDILVHIDNCEQSAAVLDLAIALARRHEAHLTGLHVSTHHHYQSQLENVGRHAAALEANFSSKTARAGISADWSCIESAVSGRSIAEMVILQAHCRDLVIVGQTDPVHDGSAEPDLPERVVLGGGRPVLVVPYAGTFDTVGERVVVAWKAGRESTRAINDAMPFLLTAGEVRVMAVDPADAGDGPCSDICAHLARHGISGKSERIVVAYVTVGDVLLNQAWEERCDLLVMGAYTQTSRGPVLGPVAKHVLRHMTMPVLMSH
jgi:nucleotide-binding universal stress UspA family protein